MKQTFFIIYDRTKFAQLFQILHHKLMSFPHSFFPYVFVQSGQKQPWRNLKFKSFTPKFSYEDSKPFDNLFFKDAQKSSVPVKK